MIYISLRRRSSANIGKMGDLAIAQAREPTAAQLRALVELATDGAGTAAGWRSK